MFVCDCCYCRSAKPLMRSLLGWTQRSYVSWHLLLTASNWSLWLTWPAEHLLGLLKEKLQRRFAKHFICLMTSLRCVMIAKSDTHVCNKVSWFIFGFWQEEKLEPLRNITDDPRIRLLNRLYARKRKELKDREKLKVFANC